MAEPAYREFFYRDEHDWFISISTEIPLDDEGNYLPIIISDDDIEDGSWEEYESISDSESFHDGFLKAYMMNGTATKTIHPPNITPYHTALLPVEICPGGIKLNTKANKEPKKPTPAIIHIKKLPFLPIRKSRGASFIM